MNHKTLKFYGLDRDPFTPVSGADIYISEGLEDVEGHIVGAVESGAIGVVSGPAGSGKTLLAVAALNTLDVTVIRVQVVPRGRMSGSHINHAILSDLTGRAVYGSLEARARAVVDALCDLHTGGQQAVLLLDPADDVPTSALSDIRIIHEMCGPFSRPLAVLMVGSPAFSRRLSSEAPLRGISQRSITVEMPPVDPVQYLAFSIFRAGGQIENVFTSDVLAKIPEMYPDATTPLKIGQALRPLMGWGAKIGEPVSLDLISSLSTGDVALAQTARGVAA